MPTVYNIKTEAFEGPFHLLLSLIEDRKLFINDISLSQVTEDYLKFIGKISEHNKEEINELAEGVSGEFTSEQIANFIVVAATLILIKSKSLLPNLNLTNEEQTDISTLESRLKQYEMFSRLSLHIEENFGKNIIFTPLDHKKRSVVFLPDDKITKESLMTFAHNALGRLPKKQMMPEVEVRKVISLEEMIDKLAVRIQDSLSINFKDFAGSAKTKEERVVVIVSFLAMLELVRQGILSVAQENNFEDMIIQKREDEQVPETQEVDEGENKKRIKMSSI